MMTHFFGQHLMQDFVFFVGILMNIERFRKIFGQLMIKCPARNRTMVFYF